MHRPLLPQEQCWLGQPAAKRHRGTDVVEAGCRDHRRGALLHTDLALGRPQLRRCQHHQHYHQHQRSGVLGFQPLRQQHHSLRPHRRPWCRRLLRTHGLRRLSAAQLHMRPAAELGQVQRAMDGGWRMVRADLRQVPLRVQRHRQRAHLLLASCRHSLDLHLLRHPSRQLLLCQRGVLGPLQCQLHAAHRQPARRCVWQRCCRRLYWVVVAGYPAARSPLPPPPTPWQASARSAADAAPAPRSLHARALTCSPLAHAAWSTSPGAAARRSGAWAALAGCCAAAAPCHACRGHLPRTLTVPFHCRMWKAYNDRPRGYCQVWPQEADRPCIARVAAALLLLQLD